jgi:hypothetical protein
MSSKRRRRRRECEGKQRFESPEAAGRMIGWLARIGRLRPGTHAYPCDFGNHWHIGRGRRGLRRQRIKSWQWNMGV